jgi:hypothetical protein
MGKRLFRNAASVPQLEIADHSTALGIFSSACQNTHFRWKGGNKSKIHHILRTAHQKWRGVRFKVGGANLSFEVRLRRGGNYYFKNKKKYHENQREKLILMIFFQMNPLFMRGPYFHINVTKDVICKMYIIKFVILWFRSYKIFFHLSEFRELQTTELLFFSVIFFSRKNK